MAFNTGGAMSGAGAGAGTGFAIGGPVGAGIGAIAGGLLGAFGGGGGDAAAKAAADQQAAQLAWNKQQDPFSATGQREQYVGQLNTLMQGGPAGVANDPMFQQLNQQNLNQVQRMEHASGGGGSGAEMLALKNQSFGNQMDYFNQSYNRLASLSGASRGGGQAALGMSPEMALNSQANYQGSMGQLGGALTQIFGQPSGGGGGGYSESYTGSGVTPAASYGSAGPSGAGSEADAWANYGAYKG